MTSADSDNPTVVFLPDFREGNPYQANLASALEDRGVSVVFGETGGMFPIWRSVRAAADVDVVHLHWLSPYLLGGSRVTAIAKSVLTLLQLVVLRHFGVSVVWTVHNLTPHGMKYPRIDLRFFGLVVRTCDRFIVHCEAVRRELSETYGDLRVGRRTRVIPHGHYLENYENEVTSEDAREALSLDGAGTVFLCFGLIRRYKGIRRLTDAFRDVASDDSRLMIVGSPEDHEFAEEIASVAEGCPRIRTVFEFVPDDEVQLYMNAADAVVLPYRDVSTSGTAILAMSFGRAVITPATGCSPELVGDRGGILYSGGDDGLRDAIEEAESTDLEHAGVHNFGTIQDYDWDGIAERTRAVYDECQ